MDDKSQEYRDHILRNRFEYFARKYAPRGRESEFHADLHMLVQAVHKEAVAPYEKTMTSMLMHVSSIVPVLTKKD